MPGWITLDTAHGPVRAWRASPARAARGAVIVIQEIFGANAHIRHVAERFAEAGFEALAPSMFDPVAPTVELGYDDIGMARGRALAAELDFDAALDILRAARERLSDTGHHCAAIGFCWGGSVALLANLRLGLPAVSYYGARSLPFLAEPLRAPMLFHFGGGDPLIPPADIERHRNAWPEARMHVYAQAGHAFNRDVDPHHHHAASAALAWRRTLDFLDHLVA
ncbi:dienelactone hydrolase family protein [Lysobacter pythonis]|uniref:Dienelactone hydrolase family protein n=1 Tax=Solilutibacter pythonis TaxID=2483112 RepID=A0A3M2I8E9_9GAMM|nr:dienelactone hydrolase family protein [Lysobacter pythonis]RMH94767.1 dienelactone hydrolase family protein [Lysobacter pythonis]